MMDFSVISLVVFCFYDVSVALPAQLIAAPPTAPPTPLPQLSWDISFPSAEAITQRSSGRPITIAVEGNVGSGKSTMINFFKDYPDIVLYPEPVGIWTDLNGTDFLDLVYHNQSRWGMSFESLVQQTMVETHVAKPLDSNHNPIPLKIMERSVHSARFCFIEQLVASMEPVEVHILDLWYKHLMERPEIDLDVDLIIYLRTSPEVVFDRMRGRDRKEEADIPLAYLQDLHRLHEDWLINKTNPQRYLPPVIVVDATADISVLNKVYRNLAKALWKAIPKQLRNSKNIKGRY